MTPSTLLLALADEAATERFGRRLAQVLPLDVVVALSGTLGAGKTRLVQAIAAGLGIEPGQVTSPTFVLCQQYPGQREGQPVMLYHTDWYRVRDVDELIELGVEELFETPGVKLVEWADRFPEFLPESRIDVRLDVTGESTREATVEVHGRDLLDMVKPEALGLDR